MKIIVKEMVLSSSPTLTMKKHSYEEGNSHKSRVDGSITMKIIVKEMLLSSSPTLTMKNIFTSRNFF
ncbi:hypothetical protein AB4Z22_42075 [Paenibacillus sp. TAF58]